MLARRELTFNAYALLHYLVAAGADRDDGVVTSHGALADVTDLSTKTVGRALRSLRDAGLIDYDDHARVATFTVRTGDTLRTALGTFHRGSVSPATEDTAAPVSPGKPASAQGSLADMATDTLARARGTKIEKDPLTPATSAGDARDGTATTPCLVCGERVRPGYRCPGCGSNPRAAGSSIRESARRRTTASDYDRALAKVRNEAWQYDLGAFRAELDRFDLSAAERGQLEQLRAELVDDDEALAW
jgi:hypothetical protein